MRRAVSMAFCAALLLLAGCTGTPRMTGPQPQAGPLPQMRVFGAPRPLSPQRSNAEIARDFLDLSFELESGTPLPVFTRFETPVTIGLTGRTTPIVERELQRLVDRLKKEARIDLRLAPVGTVEDITIEAITRAEMRRLVPQAACFVLPTRITWDQFRSNVRRNDLDWAALRVRRAATVFVPSDISPQEIRDCLHEEVAQALGPLNDLWRLNDSIFNDDNLNSVLTGFDMLVLRVTYDDALKNGMTKQQVAERLPTILARLNPNGRRVASRPLQPTSRAWSEAIGRALGGNRWTPRRRAAAAKALSIAQASGWQDGRLGLSYYTRGRLASDREGATAIGSFFAAVEVYDADPSTGIHAAHVGMQISAFALAAGQPRAALAIADRYVPAAERGENAALLADLLSVRAAALANLGRAAEADTARLDSLGWGRYGFADEAELRARADDIARLPPRSASGS